MKVVKEEALMYLRPDQPKENHWSVTAVVQHLQRIQHQYLCISVSYVTVFSVSMFRFSYKFDYGCQIYENV